MGWFHTAEFEEKTIQLESEDRIPVNTHFMMM